VMQSALRATRRGGFQNLVSIAGHEKQANPACRKIITKRRKIATTLFTPQAHDDDRHERNWRIKSWKPGSSGRLF
jgi:hypothetical protein